jgi:hypothetical protein
LVTSSFLKFLIKFFLRVVLYNNVEQQNAIKKSLL